MNRQPSFRWLLSRLLVAVCFLGAGVSLPPGPPQTAFGQPAEGEPENGARANGEPEEPASEPIVQQPAAAVREPSAPLSSLLTRSSLLSREQNLSPEREAAVVGSSASVAFGTEGTARGTTDTGDLLTNSLYNPGVYSRQLSPIMTDTRVRGYRYGQIRTTLDGAAWFPVRPDLDTPLSRFDSNIIEDVVVIRGPYNVRLGPGLAFIDVTLRDTPRHSGSPQWGGETKFTWDTNGDQWYGRQAFNGGGRDYGWHIGYGHRGGSDFTAGDDLPLAASYNVRDWDFAYGFDFPDESSVEFTYIRTDMTGVELPGQVNDIRVLTSDGFSLRYLVEDSILFERSTLNGWYNLTEFDGTLANKRSAADSGFPNHFFPPDDPRFAERFQRVTTFGDTSSAGLRSATTFGEASSAALTLGADATFRRQGYFERREDNGVVDFGVPDALQNNAGLFADIASDIAPRLSIRAGSRIDFLNSDAEPTADVDARHLALQTVTPICVRFGLPCSEQTTEQNFTLHAGYLTTEYELNDAWTLNSGIGYAERAPSPTDLYGDLPHLSVMQEGAFFIPHGNLTLEKEKALQFDLGADITRGPLEGKLSFFYSEIDDFITYDVPHLPAPSGPHEHHAIGANRDARLVGGEAYGEYTVNKAVTLFGTLGYVQGKDLERDEPLWGIAPLNSLIGLRLEDPVWEPRGWGMEYTIRMVDDQDRVSSVGFVGERRTPGFTTHDIRGYYRVNQAVSTIFGFENIGDRFYQEHLDTRLNLSQNANSPSRGVVRRGFSFYFALQSIY